MGKVGETPGFLFFIHTLEEHVWLCNSAALCAWAHESNSLKFNFLFYINGKSTYFAT